MNCPLCDGPSCRRFVKHEIWIRDCERCRHRFAEVVTDAGHVDRVYRDDYFVAGGAGYAGYLSEGPILVEQGRWYARLLARYMQKGAALDVGSAAGFWLRGLVDQGWVGHGIEPNVLMAEHARSALHLSVATETLETFESEARFDLVSMIQVIAHLADVRRSVASAAGTIRPGGALLIETWDCGSWTARILGSHWHEYSPPSVLHWFTPDRLARLGEEFGLVEVARGRPRKRIGAGHAKSLLQYKYGHSAPGRLLLRAAAVVPDTLAIPYMADDLFWMVLRRA